MHEMQTIVTDVCGVCLSVCLADQLGFTERIKMLFGVDTLGAHGTLRYTGVVIPHREGKKELGKLLLIMDPLHIY